MPIVSSLAGASALGFGIFASGAMESIATVTVGSGGAADITFSNIPNGYQHLQFRIIAPFVAQDGILQMELNGSTSGYAYHWLYGQGTTAAAFSEINKTTTHFAYDHNISFNASFLKVSIVDILDYASTTKNKTIRSFSGIDRNGSGAVQVESNLWANTSAITSVRLRYYGNDGTYGYKNFAQYSQAALYGLRAP